MSDVPGKKATASAAPPKRQQWECRRLHLENDAQLEALGPEGWEAFAADRGIVYFKRPLTLDIADIARHERNGLVPYDGTPATEAARKAAHRRGLS